MLYAKLPARIPEFLGFITRSIIRQYSFHFYAVGAIPSYRKP